MFSLSCMADLHWSQKPLQLIMLPLNFGISSFGNLTRASEGVYTWNFIPGWNSSPDEIIPVYGEMSLTVYTLLPRWNFIPGWKTGMRFHPGMKKKEKKTCKHFILGWNFKMSMFFLIFDVCIQVCFPNSACLNIMKVWIYWNIRPLCKNWSPKRKRISTTSKK